MNRITSALDAVRMDDLHSTEAQFRQSHPWCWRITLLGPILLTTGLLSLLVFQTGWEFTSKLATTALVTVLFFGRFVILSGSNGTFQDTDGSLAAEHLFAMVCYLDVMTALMLAFHIGFLFRLPYIGPRAAALVTDGHFILDAQPWMRRATFFGLIAFVGFPLAATGSIGGSIFGRLLGMSRISTFFGIVIGALLGNSIMFFFSDLLGQYLNKDNVYLKIGGFLALVLVVLILERRYRRLKSGYLSTLPHPTGDSQPAGTPPRTASESEPVDPDEFLWADSSAGSSRDPSVPSSTVPVVARNAVSSLRPDWTAHEPQPLEWISGDRVGQRSDTR